MKKRFSGISGLFALLVFFSFVNSRADEKYAPAAEWLSRGYRAVSYRALSGGQVTEKPSWAAHSLKWPARFQDEAHRIGNSMAEFQSYGDGPYYHGGCDLRVQAEEKVYAPVSGRVEAGHYGYTNHPDGSSTKYWTAWPGDGDANYFEVAVVTDDGYRFEFHHMNADQLPNSIRTLLSQGGGRVHAGDLLGQTVIWPDGVYHHTHVNILTPSGIQLNPEYYYEAISDHLAPQVQAVLAVMPDRQVLDFGTGKFTQTPKSFAVSVNDQLDSDAYVHPPVLVGVLFDSGESYFWDFRERLTGPDGKFPPIWNFYVEQLSSSSGSFYPTEGGYGTGESVIQIPVPSNAKGHFVLKIADEAGNQTTYDGVVQH